MVTDDIDEWHARASGVVQVGETVTESGAEVEKCGGRTTCDAGVSISCTGDHAFKQPEDSAHRRDVIESGHEVHLARSGVAETHVDAVRLECGK